MFDSEHEEYDPFKEKLYRAWTKKAREMKLSYKKEYKYVSKKVRKRKMPI